MKRPQLKRLDAEEDVYHEDGGFTVYVTRSGRPVKRPRRLVLQTTVFCGNDDLDVLDEEDEDQEEQDYEPDQDLPAPLLLPKRPTNIDVSVPRDSRLFALPTPISCPPPPPIPDIPPTPKTPTTPAPPTPKTPVASPTTTVPVTPIVAPVVPDPVPAPVTPIVAPVVPDPTAPVVPPQDPTPVPAPAPLCLRRTLHLWRLLRLLFE